jgi:hypothetical protein
LLWKMYSGRDGMCAFHTCTRPCGSWAADGFLV